MDQLPNFVTHQFLNSRQGQTTMKRGTKSSIDGQSSPPLWRTPTVQTENAMRGTGQDPELRALQGHTVNLQDQAKGFELNRNWPTPRTEDGESAGNHPGAQDSLTGVTRQWPTPKANDAEKRGMIAENPRNGLVSAAQKTGKKKLNPNFVDWLMGFPPGWTSVSIGFAPEEMRLYRQRQLSLLSRLLERSE